MAEKNPIMIAVIGEDDNAQDILFKSFKHTFPSKVILLVKKKFETKAQAITKHLKTFDIQSEIRLVSAPLLMEELFVIVRKIVEEFKDEALVIHTETDYRTSCFALSSAFVAGIAAIGISENQIITYPVMKFSYEHAINSKKMEVLQKIYEKGLYKSMDELSKDLKISLPLLAYHLRGNHDSKGLIELGLINGEKKEGTLQLQLTALGKLILSGCVSCKIN